MCALHLLIKKKWLTLLKKRLYNRVVIMESCKFEDAIFGKWTIDTKLPRENK